MKKNILTEDDVQAVNFREIRVGKIAPNTLYRSSHPIKELKQERAVSMLAANARIAAILNLCDTNSEIMGKAIFAPWYNRLLKNNRVLALGMDFSVTSENYMKKLRKGLLFILATDAPWLIHCHAGADRTGFFCMVLESFMGASLGEVIDDYLKSFSNGLEANFYEESYKADSLVAMKILSVMSNSHEINEQNLQNIAEIYLRNTIKLSTEEIELLRMKLART